MLLLNGLNAQANDPYTGFIQSKAESFYQSGWDRNDSYYSNDPSIDVQYYKLQLIPSLDTHFLRGNVSLTIESTVEDLVAFFLDLAPEIKITGHTPEVRDAIQGGRLLQIQLQNPLPKGDLLTFDLDFEGYPALLNDIKGLHYQLEDPENPLIASLSTPYLAHQWWPCKDGPEDKANGAEIVICIPDRTPGGKKLMAVSNGLLHEEINVPGEGISCFVWRHNYPVVPYYLMIAVAPYSRITQDYAGRNGEIIPLEYFVFEDHVPDALEGTADLPAVMSFYETVFGPYPFAGEKYGMTQLGFYGGIENQTNSIVNRMSADYFMVSVHELAHMWFGDMITCSDWHEVWLNEGFATYAECLWLESQGGPGAYRECLEKRKYLGGGTLVLESDQDPFGIFRTIAYYKGAWVLHMLRGIMGDQPFFAALRAYAGDDRLQYANASTIDFREHCERVAGIDLSQFFDQWLYKPYFPFYHYHFEQTPDQKITLYIGQKQTEEYPEAPYFKMPIDVLIRYADGTDTLIRVLNEALPLESYTFELEKKVGQVTLDPEDKVLCQKKFDQATFVPGFSKDPTEPRVYPNPFFPGQHLRVTPINEEAIYTLTNPDGRFDRLYADERGNLRLRPGKKWTPGIHFLMIRSNKKPPFQLPLVCLRPD